MTDGCPHGMPSKASCVECMYDGPVEEPKKVRRHLPTTNIITAGYSSRCPNCDVTIHEGDRIGHVDDVGWCCELCIS